VIGLHCLNFAIRCNIMLIQSKRWLPYLCTEVVVEKDFNYRLEMTFIGGRRQFIEKWVKLFLNGLRYILFY